MLQLDPDLMHDLDQWRSHDGHGVFFDDHDGAFQLHMPSGDFGTWFEQLGSDGKDISDVRIRVEDGVMTIERDGEIETYQLDDSDDTGVFEWSTERTGAPRRRPHDPIEQI